MLAPDWIDHPAVVLKAQMDPHPVRQPNEDELDKLEKHIRRLLAERQARDREAERTTKAQQGSGLGGGWSSMRC